MVAVAAATATARVYGFATEMIEQEKTSTRPAILSQAAPFSPFSDKGDVLKRLVRAPPFGTFVAAVVLFGIFAVFGGSAGFATLDGTASWLNTASELGIIAIPIALLMIAGEFDLSIGSMVGTSSVMVGLIVTEWHRPLWLAVVAGVALAIIVGTINGLLVTRTGMPSFIVTLAANLVLAGFSLVVAHAVAQTTEVSVLVSGGLARVFDSHVGQFQVSILWCILVAAGAAWVLHKTRFGNWIAATGGDAERARRAGVPTERLKVLLFVCTALASAFVGILQAVEYTTSDATSGQGYVFEAPIVVVIGGVLLTGGYGTVFGAVMGIIIYGIASTGLFYTGWDSDYAQVIVGVLMVVAVLTHRYVRRAAVESLKPHGEK